jgi:hypothetical protein
VWQEAGHEGRGKGGEGDGGWVQPCVVPGVMLLGLRAESGVVFKMKECVRGYC